MNSDRCHDSKTRCYPSMTLRYFRSPFFCEHVRLVSPQRRYLGRSGSLRETEPQQNMTRKYVHVTKVTTMYRSNLQKHIAKWLTKANEKTIEKEKETVDDKKTQTLTLRMKSRRTVNSSCMADKGEETWNWDRYQLWMNTFLFQTTKGKKITEKRQTMIKKKIIKHYHLD